MRDNTFQVLVLCEDVEHYRLLRSFLDAHGLQCRSPMFSPKGRGSGEQYVREQYDKMVQAYHSRKNHMQLVLLVMIDADLMSCAARKQQFPRQQDERILLFVPKRNIESWYHFVETGQIDEESSHKRTYAGKVKHGAVAEKLIGLCRKAIHDPLTSLPESLQDACMEWERRL